MAWFFNVLLFIAALLYATVGHGGASSYLAIFALSGDVSSEEMRASALTLNLFVSALSFLGYRYRKHFDARTFGMLIITSVPAAFLGGMLKLPGDMYKTVLGIFLLFAVLRMLGIFGGGDVKTRSMTLPAGLITGALLGFVSGMIGIGGGIILSPVLLLLGWAPIKTTAGVSAAFIFVNSAAGLLGLYFSDQLNTHQDLPIWIAIVIVGGFAGSLLGSRFFSPKLVRYTLAAVLAVAGFKLLFL